MGGRRFETKDDSRNSFILALITLGEGWHNNHHRYMSATRQGFYWWELDITYYVLKVISWTGFIWDLKGVPASIYQEAELRQHHDTVARFSMASVHDEVKHFGRIVPTAAAIALASTNSTQVAGDPAPGDSPAMRQSPASADRPGS